MNFKIRLPLLILLTGLIYVACRKTDRLISEPKNTARHEIEDKFFNSKNSTEPLVQSITKFIKKQNDKLHFVEKVVNQIGYPQWNKTIIVSGSRTTGNPSISNALGDTVEITYIPFVRDSQLYVNASLLIKTTPTDTSYKYLCDWQYSQFGFDTTSGNWSAQNVFHVFAMLDKVVFDRNSFLILDENLLGASEIAGLANANLDFDSTQVIRRFNNNPIGFRNTERGHLLMPVEICSPFSVCLLPCAPVVLHGFRNQGINISSSLSICCAIEANYEICTTVMVYIPSGGEGGSGGTGGGGTSGGGTGGPIWIPPLPPNGTTSTILGWGSISDPDPAVLQAWDDNIIIAPSVRPCITAILNNIRGIRQGAIAQMILIMSGNIPTFDWEIHEVPQLNPPNTNASAITTTGGNAHSITQLNQSILSNATNISLARTILHEAIHAFIYSYVTNLNFLTQAEKDQILALPFAKKIKQFFRLKYDNPNYSNNFHNLMVTNFHADIKVALMELCPILGLNVPAAELESFCYDLAWGGLQDNSPDSPWMELDIEDQLRIMKVIEIEQNNLPGFSGTINVPGQGNYFISVIRRGTKTCP
jgi:hypothetical protein